MFLWSSSMRGSLVIIEDEPDIAALLATRFAGEGFRVIATADGASGLRAVEAHHPRLILLDLLLPEMSDWEIVRLLKDNLSTHAIPIIILSVVSTPGERIRLLEAGVADFIVKPCSIKEVIARAWAVLRRSEWRAEVPGAREAAHEECHDPHRG